ncbi:DUF4185 domain-containing protein [Rhodococcus yananensis]|uniref:DUF4185 domain-containing protein n=1 Tax=Rhodococcus yananensis TaxID=2879464 RepID=UPI003EBCB361
MVVRRWRTGTVGICALALSLCAPVFVPATAHAEPCGHSSPGSSGLSADGGSQSSGRPSQNDQRALPSAGSGPARTVAWVTGVHSANRTHDRFTVSGTDLGIMWDNGATGADRRVLMAFGDTFGDCSLPGEQWRHNIIMRSADTDLSDGIDILDPVPGDIHSGTSLLPGTSDFSRDLVGSLAVDGVEKTVIPTAGIAVDGIQYLNLMSVRKWGGNGEWWTNASMIATSADNGESWELRPETVRVNVPVEVPGVEQVSTGNENFQQHAYLKHDGYVYDYGTPQGRFGAAFLSRVPEKQILDLAAYEYWDGGAWVPGAPDRAVPIVPPTVGELSVHYTGDKFVMLYGSEQAAGIEIRTSASPEGPWSPPTKVVDSERLGGGMYAPFIHPWSSGNDIYFTASRWSDYNVMLLHTTVP